ncbi:16S rRNA (guanine(527)-N(7))-methyltransferase RsmG [Atribacter laminatus]|uniref:Ribosomal RNA small subunit methyltransferase G n=1 Tax=Atribacter laminatus TaxID=2847778 RepID=A0A7T1AKV5_ATRLM|nr:16S rRNA (guanine(527)-N(7))-methyltransferase RsmG [Atribacter laminatus]QPM67792.1 Ribosomal RNA small subunit methyltransferase G [Atribacter laminatus]
MDNRIHFLLEKGLKELNISINSSQKDQIIYFLNMIEMNNRLFNLTGFKTHESILVELIFDSFSLLKTNFPFNEINTAIDVGTGAGIPGMPLNILFPNIHFYYLDSNHKKIDFLKIVSNHLNLDQSFFLCDRAESLGHSSLYREKFDFAMTRALSTLATNIELVTPFIKVKGRAVFFKGISYQKEISLASNSLSLLNCQLDSIIPIPIPLSNRTNHFLFISKSASTPAIYPRRIGIPQKKPL